MFRVKVNTQKVIAEIEAKTDMQRKKILYTTFKAGKMTQNIAKQKAPVDTGALRQMISLDVNKSKNSISVKINTPVKSKNGAPYGVFQEFGTSKMAGTPHIRPAFYIASNWWNGELQRIL